MVKVEKQKAVGLAVNGANSASQGGEGGKKKSSLKRKGERRSARATGPSQKPEQKEGRKPKRLLKGGDAPHASRPKMTKQERRDKYWRPKVSARMPGSQKRKLCLKCRKPGHKIASCPEAKEGGDGGALPINICFNCGSEAHSLKDCPASRTEEGLPFAKCFVCGAQGHLSAHCPQNAKGVYPQGGSCFRCKSKVHLSINCPLKPKKEDSEVVVSPSEGEPINTGAIAAKDEASPRKDRQKARPGGRVTDAAPRKVDRARGGESEQDIVGGDALEDDGFMVEEVFDDDRDEPYRVKGSKANKKRKAHKSEDEDYMVAMDKKPKVVLKPKAKVVTFK